MSRTALSPEIRAGNRNTNWTFHSLKAWIREQIQLTLKGVFPRNQETNEYCITANRIQVELEKIED